MEQSWVLDRVIGMHMRHLTDLELRTRLQALAAQERECVADVVEHLAELERRRSIADTSCGTTFDYCMKVLGYSEPAAFLRIRVARASLVTPRVIDDLRSGAVHLDAVMRLYPLMTQENGAGLLDLAAGATKREVESLVARLGGGPPAAERDIIRAVSPHRSVETPSEVIPPTRVRIAFTADERLLRDIERLKSLRRHRFPDGRLEDLIQEAVTRLLERIEARPKIVRREAARRSHGRWVPRAVRRRVWERDGGRCAFVDQAGIRCGSTAFIEMDHIIPFADGGRSDDPANLRLLCRPHNQRRAIVRFGPRRCARQVRPDVVALQREKKGPVTG
jgi:5-methylcytosine-specific restriction endonuclease McrA